MERADCIVAGAGIVGLAIARALTIAGREVIVIEPQLHIGMETSSRNSEVIHAGIYYPQGSLKAELCVAGKLALYPYCKNHGVPHRRTGKLIVATSDEEISTLVAIRAAAHANGVTDVDWADEAAVRSDQPALRFVKALSSPSTGIIDSHQFMLALQGDAEEHGAMMAFGKSMAR